MAHYLNACGLEAAMRIRISIGLLALLGLVGATSDALGQAKGCPVYKDVQAEVARARTLRKAAMQSSDQAAFDLLTCLYAQSPVFDVLVQLYQVEITLGRWVEAWEHFQLAQKDPEFAALSLMPGFAEQTAKDNQRITSQIGRLEVLVKDADTQQDLAAGTLFMDGAQWSSLPVSVARDVVAGSRQLRVEAPDYVQQSREINVRPLVEQPLNRETFVLTRLRSRWKKPGLWVGLGLGAAAVIGLGVGLGVGLQPRPAADLQLVF